MSHASVTSSRISCGSMREKSTSADDSRPANQRSEQCSGHAAAASRMPASPSIRWTLDASSMVAKRRPRTRKAGRSPCVYSSTSGRESARARTASASMSPG